MAIIRHTDTGMEQQCRQCVKNAYPDGETWWPLTAEFFRINHPGKTRLIHYGEICKSCLEERRRNSPSWHAPRKHHRDLPLTDDRDSGPDRQHPVIRHPQMAAFCD